MPLYPLDIAYLQGNIKGTSLDLLREIKVLVQAETVQRIQEKLTLAKESQKLTKSDLSYIQLALVRNKSKRLTEAVTKASDECESNMGGNLPRFECLKIINDIQHMLNEIEI